MKNIIVLGSINLDLIIKVNEIPQKGETVLGEDVVKAFGGKGANQAIACSKLGGIVYMVGAVGNDSEGKSMLNNLKDNNINTDFVEAKEAPSGMAMILVDKMDNQIVVSPGANQYVTLLDVKRSLERHSGTGNAFVTQFENPLNVVLESLKLASEKKMTVFLNPSPFQEFDKTYLQYVDYLIVNETELQKMTSKIESDNLKIQSILKHNVKLIVTLGKEGSIYYDNDHKITQKGFKVNAVDTTAAGDSFLGSIVVGVMNHVDVVQNLKNANAAGALATTKLGAQISIPTREKVSDFLIMNTSR